MEEPALFARDDDCLCCELCRRPCPCSCILSDADAGASAFTAIAVIVASSASTAAVAFKPLAIRPLEGSDPSRESVIDNCAVAAGGILSSSVPAELGAGKSRDLERLAGTAISLE